MVLCPSHLGHVHVRGGESLVQGGVGHHEVHPDKEREEEVPFDVRNAGRSQAFTGEFRSLWSFFKAKLLMNWSLNGFEMVMLPAL